MIVTVASAIAILRARTAAAHQRVDAAFSAYDLKDADAYRNFLLAHARALPAAERLIASQTSLPGWRPRTLMLTQDLAVLGMEMPAPIVFTGQSTAFSWGVQYVVEGSRLGGSILADRVAAGLPATYLRARHLPGEWRSFGHALDACAQQHGADWLDHAIAGADACFDMYWHATAHSGLPAVA